MRRITKDMVERIKTISEISNYILSMSKPLVVDDVEHEMFKIEELVNGIVDELNQQMD